MLVMLVRHLTTWSVLSVADIPLGPGLGPINPVAPLGLSTMASFEPELYHQLLEGELKVRGEAGATVTNTG